MRLRRHPKLEAVPVPSQASLFFNPCDSYVILPEKKPGRLEFTLVRIQN